ncbi:MAG: CHAT domain-containing protein [Rhodospirillaceae bacterium]|nr:CHAT domain-containing protein [Rhodospirillaceae bacterium]
MFDRLRCSGTVIVAAVLFSIGSMPAGSISAQAQTPPAAARPPRSIVDITAVLDQQKPNPDLIARRQQAAAAEPPATATGNALAQFYFKRAQAHADLGRPAEAIADADRAAENVARPSRLAFIIDQFIVGQNAVNNEPTKSLRVLMDPARSFAGAPASVRLSMLRQTGRVLMTQGDMAAAEANLKTMETVLAEARSKASVEDLELFGSQWQANLDWARGSYFFFARGDWKEAEAAFAKAEPGFQETVKQHPRWPVNAGQPLSTLQLVVAQLASLSGWAKLEQGRMAEAEVDARRALLGTVSATGKYHSATAAMCRGLALVLRDQGRYEESEQLLRVNLEILRTLGFPEESDPLVNVSADLANLVRLQGRWAEAAAMYAAIDNVTKDWPPLKARRLKNDVGRILTLYNTGNVAAGLEAASSAAEIQRARVGTGHFNYAVAEGYHALGLALAGRNAAALQAFRAAVPVLALQSGDDESTAGPGRRQRHTVRIIEADISLRARLAGTGDVAAVATETFGLADTLRGRSVASALAASSARGVSQDPVLAALARREQDLRKEIAATFGLLNNVLALPATDRDDSRVGVLRDQVARLRDDHGKVRLEIGVRFPAYADLIDPKPATAEQVRAALRPDEAFVSFYFGAEKSFVWALSKTGPATFAVIPATAGDIEAKVKKLREALEPNVTSVADIPAFDLALAHELYTLLLKPIEATWRPARNLVVATNGALGLLPLGVLPTAPVTMPADAGAAFAAYRGVPWLARTHAVSLMPSAAAFRTLRQLPASAPGRQPLIGFGDPVFNTEQAADALKNAPPVPVTPGSTPLERRSAPQTAGLASATLASLPALPDTADELRSVAKALKTDGSKVLNLGKAASEENVTHADLSKYRVVAFATHGLVAGELDGLHQPALALSAPSVTGGTGDGLLTLEKILGLKLDADWVVLSACNTGAGDGAGAEAASGLGRAFFYAGTRAILVTNWSVHSQSARDLVTDLFRRQAADPTLTRAEALREAMIGVMDGPGFTDDKGKPVFTYAHPLFWAPYTIIGDGG